MKAIVMMIFLVMLGFGMPALMAEEGLEGVAGCSSVTVNPELSMDDQQSICRAAEGISGTSCAASGNGLCSSPKLNDTMPEADHCICVREDEILAEAPVV